MAKRLRLANRSQSSTVDLLSGTLKIDNRYEGKTPKIIQKYNDSRYGSIADFVKLARVKESFGLSGFGTDTALIAAEDLIEDVAEEVRLWHDDELQDESWWLEFNTANESAKRALIYEMTMRDKRLPGINAFLDCGGMRRQLDIVRHPLWETPTAVTISPAAVEGTGGAYAITGIVGTAPARIKKLSIVPDTFTGSNIGWWVGIRPQRSNSANAFINLWDCDGGTAGTGCGASTVDATASPEQFGAGTGRRRDVTFGTASLARRWWIKQEDVDPFNPDDYIGRYLVILRYKVTAGATVYVELRSGYEDNSSKMRSQGRYVTSSSWTTVNMGTIQMPPKTLRGESVTVGLRRYALEVWAEHISGTSGTDVLSIDTLALVPYSHVVAPVQNISAPTSQIDVYTLENDDMQMVYFDTSVASPAPDDSGYIFAQNEWYLPTGTSYLILQDAAGSVFNTYDLTIEYYPRWKSYRSA